MSAPAPLTRFAGRGPFIGLRRYAGEREARENEIMALVTLR
jgi:hypothetical protein